MKAEQQRLRDTRDGKASWKRWGPYLSERQWGTVREDYSEGGDAWDYFTHEQSRSRAYRWGEDGLAGVSDDKQRLCISLALWNEQDPILKERAYGLTNSEGNHGEDVKEYYFYLDNTPTHSYMRYLYKYVQGPYPYEDLRSTNSSRNRNEPEYELLDTGAFNDDRYFDVFVEYAKADPETMLVRITACNRGPDPAPLRVLPSVWFRNLWADDIDAQRPSMALHSDRGKNVVITSDEALGERRIDFDEAPRLLFCENETNSERLFGTPNATPYVKDGINQAVVAGDESAVNPANSGTKMAAEYSAVVPPGKTMTVRFQVSANGKSGNGSHKTKSTFGAPFDAMIERRRREADDFYNEIAPASLDTDQRLVFRQSLAGMLWSKQYYSYDVARWMEQHGAVPPSRDVPRNGDWFHLLSDDIISMPDKWEYPWFAAWDLAFHAISLATVDSEFAKHQLELMLDDRYIDPNGQIAAYEWGFGDVNPPVHAFATIYVYNLEKEREGVGDLGFLERSFQRLLLNFTWWVNRKDPSDRNVFQGGFLGLDNIGVFDRSAPLPTGGTLEQADGTAWMALYCQNMLQIALELAMHNENYESMAIKFVEHFLWIASAMDALGDKAEGLWDEDDGFYYDLLRFPDGTGTRLKVRSTVGLLPLGAATVFEPEVLERFPGLQKTVREFVQHHPNVIDNIAPPGKAGKRGRIQLAALDETRLRRVLKVMLDEKEFLGDHGLRAISRVHLDNPYTYYVNGNANEVKYLPAESDTGMFGGNSNWRGPIWFPTNAILIRAIMNLHLYYGDDFQIECPTGSGKLMNLFEVGQDLCHRLESIFLRDKNGRRPVFGGMETFQSDPYWRDHILFHEYFHGDNGAGIGASHQTGWTGLVAPLMLLGEVSTSATVLGHEVTVDADDKKSETEKQVVHAGR